MAIFDKSSRIDKIMEHFKEKLKPLNEQKLGDDNYTRFHSFLTRELHQKFLDNILPENGNWKVGTATTILLSALRYYLESSQTPRRVQDHFDLILQHRDTYFGIMIPDNELLHKEIDQYNSRF